MWLWPHEGTHNHSSTSVLEHNVFCGWNNLQGQQDSQLDRNKDWDIITYNRMCEGVCSRTISLASLAKWVICLKTAVNSNLFVSQLGLLIWTNPKTTLFWCLCSTAIQSDGGGAPARGESQQDTTRRRSRSVRWRSHLCAQVNILFVWRFSFTRHKSRWTFSDFLCYYFRNQFH